MLRILFRATVVQLRVPMGILDLEEVGERGWQWLAMASPTVP